MARPCKPTNWMSPDSLLKITVAANGGQLEGHMLDQVGERIARSAGAVFLMPSAEAGFGNRSGGATGREKAVGWRRGTKRNRV